MELILDEFVKSDTGLLLGWLLVLICGGDVAFGIWFMRHNPHMWHEKGLKNLFTVALFLSIFGALVGAYILNFHL